MPKTNINTILKNGASTKIKSVDYSSPKKIKELKELRKRCDRVLRNKEVNWHKMDQIVMTI